MCCKFGLLEFCWEFFASIVLRDIGLYFSSLVVPLSRLVSSDKDLLSFPWADGITSGIAVVLGWSQLWCCGWDCSWPSCYQELSQAWILSGPWVNGTAFSTLLSRVALRQKFTLGSSVSKLITKCMVGMALTGSWEGCCLVTERIPEWAGLALYHGWEGLEPSPWAVSGSIVMTEVCRPGSGDMNGCVSTSSWVGWTVPWLWQSSWNLTYDPLKISWGTDVSSAWSLYQHDSSQTAARSSCNQKYSLLKISRGRNGSVSHCFPGAAD